ncbi:MAG: hypothetical protein LBJ12_00135 [Oscillospiraceae bacterium]|jgi:hypothetical protein|nr:hypothetical protein [Oscillospiraceae bacterium]
MDFILSRVTGNALGFVLALFAVGVLRLIRKDKNPVLIRVFSGAGAAGALYLMFAAIQRLLKFADSGTETATLLTAYSPLVLVALTLALLFVFLLVTARKSTGAATTAAVASGVQLVLAAYNLVAHWRNYTNGSMIEWLYLQLVVVVLALLATVALIIAAHIREKSIAAKLPSGLGTTPGQYKKLGLQKGRVEQWEDGARTDGGPGSYEWWYFDSHLDDGTSLVLVYYTKRMMTPDKALAPYATIDLDTPDGQHFEERLEAEGIPFSASKDGCEVHIGPCYIKGNLDEYDIYFKNDVAETKVHLKSNVPPWRPETGHIFFGDEDESYFAWLPSVPEGNVEAEITVNGVTSTHTGTGYHDHNWGNVNMMKLMNHWYWGRARIGDYRVITSYIYGEKKYGYEEYPIFLIAKEGEHLADGGKYLTFTPSEEFINPETGKPVHGKMVYDYNDGEKHFRITYQRKSNIINYKMIDQLMGLVRLGARLIGFDGAYHRFAGNVTLERLEGDTVAEKIDASAIWELMYFGHIPK